jgi:hypothetical protein
MSDKKLVQEELVAEIRKLVLRWVQKVMADALYERERYLISNWLGKYGRGRDWREFSPEKDKKIAAMLSQDNAFRFYCEAIDNLKWIENRMSYQSLKDPLLPDDLQQELLSLLKDIIETMEGNEQKTNDCYRRIGYWVSKTYYQHLLNLLNSEYVSPNIRQLGQEFRSFESHLGKR